MEAYQRDERELAAAKMREIGTKAELECALGDRKLKVTSIQNAPAVRLMTKEIKGEINAKIIIACDNAP